MRASRGSRGARMALAPVAFLIALGWLSACSPTSVPAGSSPGAVSPARPDRGATSAAPPEGAAAPAARESVRLAYTSIAGVTAVPVIAQERGFFTANGLDAELTYVASAATAVQSLLSGELSAVLGGTEAIVNADAAGADLKIFVGLVNVVPFSLIVRPEISRPDELVGQRLGVSRLGSASDYALRAALRIWNLDAARDVGILQLGGIPEIRAGLESGAVAAGTLSLPVLAQARRDGFRELMDLASLGIDYQTTSVAAPRRFLVERPAAASNLVRALSEAIRVIKTDRASTVATFRALIHEDDEQVLEETYERYGLGYIQRIPAPSPTGVAAVQQQLATTDPRVAALSVDDLLDPTVVDRLEADGYYARLYGEQ
jgi:NitT/TauT family transport system substrate-binding protein